MSCTRLNEITLSRCKVVKKAMTEWRTESVEVPLSVDFRSEADQSKPCKFA